MRFDVKRVLTMLALIVSGEAIFSLPFVVARVFRPTLLDTFQITNLELGTAFSLYGIVAMLSYFPGGALADRFSAKAMMITSLLTTAIGGVLYAQIPSMFWLKCLFFYWGLSTILFFWAAIIRATRVWGGEDGQGRAFGILDGGRGLFAAILASGLVIVFGSMLPEDIKTATLEDKRAALGVVIWIMTVLTALAGLLVYLCVPSESASDRDRAAGEASSESKLDLSQMGEVLKNPLVWLQGMIIITAYTGYKGMDDLSLLARDTFLMDEVEAAQVSTIAFWTRPVAALAAGFLGDRFGGMRTIIACFVTMIIGNLVVAVGLLEPTLTWTLFLNVVVTGAAVYGLRGLYFAIFDDAGVPAKLTGTAVGLVSVIGYTPDIFIGPINGYLTDTYKGALGHQYFFGVLAVFSAIGLISAILFKLISEKKARLSEV